MAGSTQEPPYIWLEFKAAFRKSVLKPVSVTSLTSLSKCRDNAWLVECMILSHPPSSIFPSKNHEAEECWVRICYIINSLSDKEA